ncbi:hypothetical protein [Massilia varians]|uniref:hypothetical protein n=1 Tax=Massilia varians TaxID=457921 RepID=UPI002556BC28|nr:hypothetical protein [Massilia varians]MDK6079491.1 hypothetical protein [Massilia varians]
MLPPEREAKSCPAVLQYVLAADGRHSPPAVESIKKALAQGEPADAIELLIVSGALDNAAALTRAVELSSRHADAGLCVAFCEREPDDSLDAPLLEAFDAVFTASSADAAAAARQLSRSLLIPAHATHWIACEWGGLRSVVKESKNRRAIYGLGSANRHLRATQAPEAAYVTAIEQIERQQGRLQDAKAVCLALITGAPDLAVTDAMALVTRLRDTLGPTAAIYLSMGCDESLPVEQLDVSLFAFSVADAVGMAAANGV